MERPPRWYRLPTFPDLPALLVSALFTQSSYTLHVTDLANVWLEKLDRKAVLLRSLQENTSIDLSDGDPEQWAVFMSKLQAAFDPTSPDHHLTSIGVAAANDSKIQDGLRLRVTCDLPHPLDPLKWTVQLAKCQPASLASELVLPLIQTHHAQSYETRDLADQLRAKDAVIAKLLDKLDAMRIPLEQTFNALSAKHAITRAAAEDKIKGLAPFNEAKWREQQTIPTPEDASALLQSVFGESGFGCETAMDFGVSDTLNNWWKHIGSRFHASSRSETKISLPQRGEDTASSSSSSEEADDKDFQSSRTLQADDDDTASESEETDADAPRKTTKHRAAAIGRIGKASLSRKENGSLPASRTGTHEDTASDSDSGGGKPPSTSTPSPNKLPTTPKKGRLGQIGGKSKVVSSPVKSPVKQAPDGSPEDAVPAKKHDSRKIGAIGKDTRAEAKRMHSDTPPEPEESETEEQKAERKRAELAKELSSKANAPVKKKRKF
ncbi:XLF-domain-containing protein [Xylariaceae sp. FL0594]|nr:XLF-domain-containing protein [Xylariaceae sp. FL0594]